MIAKRVLLLVVLSVLSSLILTVGGLLNHQAIRMIDFWTDRFGFPYYWLEHVSVTFAGVTDYWHLETSNLVKNIALYFLPSFGLWAVLLLSEQRRTESKKIK